MPDLHLLTPRGFRAGAAHAGIRTTPKPDVGLLICDTLASAAAVFTTNKVVAAPVIVGKKNVALGKLRGVVVNAGNANACTGKQGLRDAQFMCEFAAEKMGCDANEILPSSTGIIGHTLPMNKISRGIELASGNLGATENHALQFGDAILTTDLKRKSASAQIKIGREKITIAGVCKGSGMIGPRLGPPHATMLAYLTTDAKVAPPLLRKLLFAAAEKSFNAVTVDDHASTNDTACILASNLSATINNANQRKFAAALDEVCASLAYQIAADGEGATKVVRIEVTGAKNDVAAKMIARTIANSPLVKCAMNGNDPNWGRIVSAAGNAGVAFDPEKSVLKIQGINVFRRGQPVDFDAGAVSKMLAVPEVRVELACNLGSGKSTCWTCDFSKEYVTINADYHT